MAQAGFSWATFLPRAAFFVPPALIIGVTVREYVNARKYEDALVEKRVAQRLGEWVPPKLTPQERKELEAERAELLKDIAQLEAKIQSRQAHTQTDTGQLR